MADTGFQPLTGGKRWMGRQMRKGVRGVLIKRLAELIKNCDDAYDRLEIDGKKTDGLIQVAFDSIKSGKGYSPKGFLVRDFGIGMSEEVVKSAYFKNVHGDDTSGESRNGAIGVGGKDAFVDMVDCFVFTVHDDILTVVELKTDKPTGQVYTKILTESNADQPLEFANKLLSKGNLEEISLSKNQTLTLFRLPDEESGARPDTLAKQLSQYYTLRWIMESKLRTVTLTDLVKCDTLKLSHSPIEGELLFEKTIEIPFDKVPYKIDIQFFRSNDVLDHKRDYGDGILVTDQRGAILDNQMYGYEDDSAARQLFGRVTFDVPIKTIYKATGGLILTDNRDGLEYAHDINKMLKQHILTNLKPLIDAEREKQGDNPELDKNLDTRIKKAMDYLNKLVDNKPNISLPIPPVTPPAEGIEFESTQYTFTPLKPQNIRLFINPGMIPTDSAIALSLIGDGVTIKPDSVINTPLSYDTNQDGVVDSKDDIPFVEIEVTGKDLTQPQTITIIKAIYGDYEAETTINVIFETVLRQPANGFSFMPTKITLLPKKPRKIQLVIDTNQIPIGNSISLTCNDDRIKFSPDNLTVSGPPNIGKYLTQEIITISGEKVGIKAKLTAEVESKASRQMEQTYRDIRTSTCDIQIKEKQPPKTFFKDYRLDRKGDKRIRSSFDKDEGIINIHVNAPILKYTFGKNQENIIGANKTPDALALLADEVVKKMTFELAKHLVETNTVDVLDDDTTAIQTTQGDLEYDHGLNLTQLIIKGAAKHEKDL